VSKGTPYQSCLEPFIDEIVGLRQSQHKRPVSCAKIAKYMKDKHKITVTRQAIYEFLKIRAKGYKPCKYAGNIEALGIVNQPTTEVLSLPKQTVSEVQETPTQSVAIKSVKSIEKPRKQILNMEWSDSYNLTRMSDEEAAARNKRIEEKRRILEEEQRKKENQSKPTEQPQEVEFNMKWSDVYNLTRMSDEEAEARNKRIEEKRKRLNEEKLKKEKQ